MRFARLAVQTPALTPHRAPRAAWRSNAQTHSEAVAALQAVLAAQKAAAEQGVAAATATAQAEVDSAGRALHALITQVQRDMQTEVEVRDAHARQRARGA